MINSEIYSILDDINSYEPKVKNVDICCGLSWGDEAKGKIVSHLTKVNNYDFVCRWGGGSNAGHTIYKDGVKFKTHIVPCGIFYGVKSIIGPGCVVNKKLFQKEIHYLNSYGFDTSLIKIHRNAHIITEDHISADKEGYKSQGSTNNGIAPCYRDKYARIGRQVGKDDFFYKYLWDQQLYGNILCEGAQGYWLDIDKGNYPYVTSSTTLPYGACSLGFSPKLIRNIYGACKMYDTRVGTDPEFPETLLDNLDFKQIIEVGQEYGTTTNRIRKVNWLNMDKLIEAINVSGTNIVVISKVDVIEKVKIYKIIHNNKIVTFNDISEMKTEISNILNSNCQNLERIIYSSALEGL